MPVSLIAAVADNGVIGRDGKLPWHLPEDLRRFKRLTQGHHLIVGRATWESVGKPLPGRTFIVVTSRGAESGLGAGAARSVAEALRWAQESGDDEPFVAGGTGIFREALEHDLVDRLQLTRIHRSYEGDTRFPDFDLDSWRLVDSESHTADAAADRPAFDFLVYERARPRA